MPRVLPQQRNGGGRGLGQGRGEVAILDNKMKLSENKAASALGCSYYRANKAGEGSFHQRIVDPPL